MLLNQSSSKVSVTHFLDVERVNCWLSIATNLLTLGTASGAVMGCVLVWQYLNGFGLGHEIMGILSAPHYLLVAAVFALAISAWMIGLVLIIPSILRALSNPDYHHQTKRKPIKSWLLHALLCFCPLVCLAFMIQFNVSGLWLLVSFFVLITLQVVILRYWYGGPSSQKIWDEQGEMGWVSYILSLVMTLTLLFILLCYGFLLVGELASRISDSELINWLLAVGGCLVYSLAVTTTLYRRHVIVSYLPASVLGMVMFVSFLTNINNNIVASMRIGHFEDTLGVSKQVVQEQGDDHRFEITRTQAENGWQIENAWVIANLPDQIVISPAQGSESKLTIPKKEIRPETHWLD